MWWFAKPKKQHVYSPWGLEQHRFAVTRWEKGATRLLIRDGVKPCIVGEHTIPDEEHPDKIYHHPAIVEHAFGLDRYPGTPGNFGLEIESLLMIMMRTTTEFTVVPLCEICWRLHPASEE